MSEAKFILKVLSGPHTGAEYFLPSGTTRLGNSMQCDLVLHDKGIADEHFLFTRSAEGVQVQCLASDFPVLFNNKEQTDPFTIRDFGLLTTASLYLAIGAEDEPWRIPPPSQLFVQPAESAPPVDEVEEQAPHEEAEGETDKEDIPADIDELPDNVEPAPHARWPHRIKTFLNLSVPAALVLAVGLYLYRHTDALPSDPVASRPTIADIRKVAKHYRIDAEFELNNNILSIKGYALNATDEHEFIRDIHNMGITTNADLIISEQYGNNLEVILEQYFDPGLNAEVTVSVAEHDIKKLRLQGYVQDGGEWDRILSDTGITDNVSFYYIDEVTHWEDGYQYLQRLIDSTSDLRDQVYLLQDRQTDRIILHHRGNYRNDDQAQWTWLADEYHRVYQYPELVVNMEFTPNRPEFVTSRLLGASFNTSHPYILFDDGKQYFVGSITPDGYLIEEINEDFATLSRAGKWYSYRFVKDQRGNEES